MIVILRLDHSVLYFSPFAEELTGYCAADVLGKDYSTTFLPEAYRQPVADEIQRVRNRGPAREFRESRCCAGMARTAGWCGTPGVWMITKGRSAVLAVGQDITTLKQAQEQALQSERLAAIGQMMTGLVHESGNALARSKACLEMLAWEVEDRPEALELIGRIQKAQNHLKHLYEEVRGYAAPIKLDREIWDLSGIWRQAWENLSVSRQGHDALAPRRDWRTRPTLQGGQFPPRTALPQYPGKLAGRMFGPSPHRHSMLGGEDRRATRRAGRNPR